MTIDPLQNKLSGTVVPRSNEYTKLLQELKDSITSAANIAQRLYEQGKRDGLTNESIRKDIELALEGIVKERQLRNILPLELKQTKFANKVKAAIITASPLLEKEHWYALDCWCNEDKGGWVQSIDIHGYVCGSVWNNDWSILCWLCMSDEIDHGPLHHTVRPMYTNEEFSHHLLLDHIQNKGWEVYTPYLPKTSLYGEDWPKRKRRSRAATT